MSRRGRRVQALVSGLLGVLLSGALIWGTSEAAFRGTTAAAGNWAAGTVVLGDDDGGAALFNVSGIRPGDTGTKCILVTYSGSVAPTGVRLYVQSLTGTLGPYLTVTLEQGTGGTSASCAGFAAEVSTSGTLAALAGARTNYGNGFGTWTPTGATPTKAYRISWSIAADNNAANRTAGATLRWEAQG
jgi:hypothetical protein